MGTRITNVLAVGRIAAGTVTQALLSAHRKLLTVLFLVLIIGSLSPARPVAAHGTNLPYHQSRSADCSSGFIASRPPSHMRSSNGRLEAVYWRVDLYRFDGSTYRLINNSQPWLYASANQYGLQTNPSYYAIWFIQGRNAPISRPLYFSSLSSGLYAVQETFYWAESRLSHTHWSYYNNNTTTSSCRM